MSEYQSVWRWSEIAWEKCGVVQNSAEMIGGGIGGNMVHNMERMSELSCSMSMITVTRRTRVIISVSRSDTEICS